MYLKGVCDLVKFFVSFVLPEGTVDKPLVVSFEPDIAGEPQKVHLQRKRLLTQKYKHYKVTIKVRVETFQA